MDAAFDIIGEPPRLRPRGDWTLPHAAELARAITRTRERAADFDASALGRMDAAGALLLLQLAERSGVDAAQLQLPAEQAALLQAVRDNHEPVRLQRTRESAGRQLLERIGRGAEDMFHQSRSLLGFFGLTLVRLLQVALNPRRLRATATVYHMEHVGLDAVPLVALLSFLVGAVVAFLGATVLRDFGAEIYVVELVSFSFMREFGVLLTAILLAGRTASAFTAQIGSMKSNQEIDAIRTLGLDPIELLVIPRLLALLAMLPLLAFIATVAGIAGGLFVGELGLGISTELFLTRLNETRELRHFLVGIGKAPVFAVMIALVGCLEGFKVTGTAESVGERTTSSVVQSIFLVIVVDAIAAIFFMEMGW